MEVEARLPGGFINGLHRERDVVVKHYEGDRLIGVPWKERFLREKRALERFGDRAISPQLHDVSRWRRELTMEFIPSEVQQLDEYLHVAPPEERTALLTSAGQLLRQVHEPAPRIDHYDIKRYYRKIDAALKKAEPVFAIAGLDGIALKHMMVDLIDMNAVREAGATYVHRDPWMNNYVLHTNGNLVLVDWETSGIGSPYEDFAIVNLWIEREHGDIDAFWEGYGSKPDHNTVLGYLVGKCVQMLATATPHTYATELQNGGGIYSGKVAILREITEHYRSQNQHHES